MASKYDGMDPWSELGISRDASASEIRRAYRKKAMQSHPDVNPSPEAAAQFARIAAAYDILKDNDKFNKWQKTQQRSAPRSRPSGTGGSTTGYTSTYDEKYYDDAGGDSFGSIFGDVLRGFASAPKKSARAVVDDLLDVLESIPIDPSPRTFETEAARAKAERDQRNLVDRLDTLLRLDIIPNIAKAKADEATARAKNDIDGLLSAIEHVAGLQAKKTAAEKQLKLAKRDLEAISRATIHSAPPSSSTYKKSSRDSASSSNRRTDSSYRTSKPPYPSSPRPPPSSGWSYSRPPLNERVDDELNRLKRNMGRGTNKTNKKN